VTLSTSVTNNPLHSQPVRKTMIIYAVLSVICVMIDKIYSLFGHGVYSASMSLMFLFPLLGGVLPYLLLWIFIPQADQVKSYRFSYNSYNSGIATLTVGSMLKGIFDIAGTASPLLAWFSVCGWSLLAIGVIAYLTGLVQRKRTVQIRTID
jgi:hypothetical protein